MTRLQTSLLFVMLAFTFACKDKKGAIPADAAGRVQALADHVPAKLDQVVVIDDLDALRTKVTAFRDGLPSPEMIDSVIDKFKTDFGVDLLDAESWKNSGIPQKNSILVAEYRKRTLLVTYVDNRPNFEKFIGATAKKTYKIEAVAKQSKVGDLQIKTLSDDPAKQVAWTYDGKMAFVIFPSLTATSGLDEGTASVVVADVANCNKADALGTLQTFQSFSKAMVPEHLISMFMNPGRLMENPNLTKELKGQANTKEAKEWISKNVDFLGAGLTVSGQKAMIKILVGAKPELLKTAKTLKAAPAPLKWDNFTTEKMMLGLRITVDGAKTVKFVMETLPEDQRRGLRRNLKGMSDMFGVDMETDVLNQLQGNVGVFFYGIAGNPMSLIQDMRDPAAIISKLGLMVVAEFKDEATLAQTTSKIVAAKPDDATLRPLLVEDEQVPGFSAVSFKSPQVPGQLFVHKNKLAFATMAFGDPAIVQYFSGKRADKKIGDVEGLDLGKEFSATDLFNGLYFNAKRAQDNLGGLMSMAGGDKLLNSVEEAQIKLDVDDAGIFGVITIDTLKKATPEPTK